MKAGDIVKLKDGHWFRNASFPDRKYRIGDKAVIVYEDNGLFEVLWLNGEFRGRTGAWLYPNELEETGESILLQQTPNTNPQPTETT